MEAKVTFGCDSCHYIARFSPDDPACPGTCFNGHGPLAPRNPQLGQKRIDYFLSLDAREDSRIVGVAVIWRGVFYTLPKPYRHGHVVSMIHEVTGDTGIMGEQGFVDQHGSFLNRREAKAVAERTGQIIRPEPVLADLYSENLW